MPLLMKDKEDFSGRDSPLAGKETYRINRFLVILQLSNFLERTYLQIYGIFSIVRKFALELITPAKILVRRLCSAKLQYSVIVNFFKIQKLKRVENCF